MGLGAEPQCVGDFSIKIKRFEAYSDLNFCFKTYPDNGWQKVIENRMDWVRYFLHLKNTMSNNNNSIYMKHISDITRNVLASSNRGRRQNGSREPWSLWWIFIHGTDKVDEGLKVLFFGLVFFRCLALPFFLKLLWVGLYEFFEQY